jgi:threonine/homoserine/homoserine lactone efflux protein
VSIAFLVTTLIVVATPGTGVVYTLAAGISRGRRAGVVAAVGCTLGILPHLAVSVTGLAALLAASPVAFRIVTYLGVAYLLYMAIATLRDRDALVVAGDGEPKSSARVVLDGVLVNLLNPKLTMFFVAFLPQFVDPARPGSTARMLLLGGVFMLATFVVFAVYAVIAAAVRERVVTRPRVLRWLRRVFAVSFVALGARLALAAR